MWAQCNIEELVSTAASHYSPWVGWTCSSLQWWLHCRQGPKGHEKKALRRDGDSLYNGRMVPQVEKSSQIGRSPIQLKWLNTPSIVDIKVSLTICLVDGIHWQEERSHHLLAVKWSVIKKKIHNFRMLAPNNINEAHPLYKVNGNTLWGDAIAKEMKSVRRHLTSRKGMEGTSGISVKRSKAMDAFIIINSIFILLR